MDITWEVFSREREGRNGGEGTGKKKNWQALNRWGEVKKDGIRNRELKEVICTTHGCELRGENAGGVGGAGQRGDKGGKLGKL